MEREFNLGRQARALLGVLLGFHWASGGCHGVLGWSVGWVTCSHSRGEELDGKAGEGRGRMEGLSGHTLGR